MASPTQELVTFRAVEFLVTADQIAATKAKYAALDATTPAGYEEVRLAIGEVRGTRVSIEKHRVDLKAEALDYGRRVDAEARRYTLLLEEIEAPLVAKKKAIDDEKARVKAEAEAAKLKELQDRLAAEREAEDARLRAVRETEEQRLAAERAELERDRAALAEERRKADEATAIVRAAKDERLRVEREREREEREAEAARLKAERDALDAERRVMEDERIRLKAEADAAAKVEADRLAKAERDALIASLLPDARKLDAYAAALRAVPVPTVKARQAKRALEAAVGQVEAVAASLTAIESKVA